MEKINIRVLTESDLDAIVNIDTRVLGKTRRDYWKKKIDKILSLLHKRYEYTLATPDGRWLGNGLGDLIDHKFIVDENVKFQQKGKYKYIINHEMRIDKLSNIQTIGLIVKKRD